MPQKRHEIPLEAQEGKNHRILDDPKNTKVKSDSQHIHIHSCEHINEENHDREKKGYGEKEAGKIIQIEGGNIKNQHAKEQQVQNAQNQSLFPVLFDRLEKVGKEKDRPPPYGAAQNFGASAVYQAEGDKQQAGQGDEQNQHRLVEFIFHHRRAADSIEQRRKRSRIAVGKGPVQIGEA